MNLPPESFRERKSGLLAPIRAMPNDGDFQGTLGAETTDFLEIMRSAGFSVLHDLPNNPPDQHNCPYSSVSTFAINPQRIDLEKLVELGDMSRSDLTAYQALATSGEDIATMRHIKEIVLAEAFRVFDSTASPERKDAFARWQHAESSWLEPFAAFEILAEVPQNRGRAWQDWQYGKDYSPQLVAQLKHTFSQEFSAISYSQWVAEQQTLAYLDTAERLGIEVWGDVPFYVGAGDVWANRDMFNLDADGNQLDQGGAAPSLTSDVGQAWGNPTYKIDPEKNPDETAKAIDWWVARLSRAAKLSRGRVRLDHFIGYAEPYIIPAGDTDGRHGSRVEGMGSLLLDRLVDRFGKELPFYPEDLGAMTEKTPELRDRYGLLRTAIAVRSLTRDLLTESFDTYAASPNNPANYDESVVGFSGNHDSPPLVEGFDRILKGRPEAIAQYIGYVGTELSARLSPNPSSCDLAQIEMERVVRSDASVAVTGIWDFLSLGGEHQYNRPGTMLPENWSWRMDSSHVQMAKQRAAAWRRLNETSGRVATASSS